MSRSDREEEATVGDIERGRALPDEGGDPACWAHLFEDGEDAREAPPPKGVEEARRLRDEVSAASDERPAGEPGDPAED